MAQSEEKHEDSLYVDKLFQAISNKDGQALAFALDHSTVETILQFKLRYGHSPLAYCCTLPSTVSHQGLVRRLLSSGLCDSEMVADSEGRTVLAKLAAHAHNDESAIGWLKYIIPIVIDGVDDATACYRMLKHNSLELFQTFLAVKQYDETKLFECLNWAVTKINVKKFPLTTNLSMFVLWKLADYGYRYLSGDGPMKRTDEWKDHIDVISDCWRVIADKYDTGTYNDIEDRLLYRLHVIHNHLYFLQHKPCLKYLPLREAVFCVAIFINIFRFGSKFDVYRFMVHKRLVVDAMRMLSFQLVLAKKCLESAELELASLMKAGECFIAERKNRLIVELVQRIERLGVMGNHRQPTGRSSNNDTNIESMIQRLQKVDKHWAAAKMLELKAIQQTHRDHLIELLESRLGYVQHPQNVADRIMARRKRTGRTASEIVAEIVANEWFDLEHLMRGKDRRTRRKLIKCYSAMKQLYSLDKIVTTFSRMANVDPTKVEVFRDCLKRAVTVLGETLKSTNSTPNMPNGRLVEAIECMLTDELANTVIFHRNNYAGEFSLPKLLVDGELERRIYAVLPHHTAVIRMAINLLLAIVLADVRRSFYGALVRCGSLAQLRTLLIFAGVRDVMLQMQHNALQEVRKYFTDAKTLFAELREGQTGQSSQFLDLEKQFLVQCSIVEELEAMVATESELNFESVRATCFSCNCHATIRRLLHWKIDSCSTPNQLLETICMKWDPCVMKLSHVGLLDPRLVLIDPTAAASKLTLLQAAIISASESHCLSRTRELIAQLAGDSIGRIDEDSVQMLNKLLRPYYRNIFCLDNKWKVLKSFCQQRQLPWDTALVRTLRQADEQYLQALFDERRSKLRTILEQNDVRTSDVLHVGVIIMQQDILPSLEHLQLELCGMLTAVGYFGDSFYYVKHRIPMIQGKNYRNLLAHDAMSYNLLTGNGDAMPIINAYIFANTEVDLFGNRTTNDLLVRKLRFPTTEDTACWVEEQEQLLGAIKSNDLTQFSKLMHTSAGEIKSLFCSSPNVEHYPPTSLSIVYHVQGIALLDPPISAYLSLYIAKYESLRDDPKFLLESAVIRRDFETAVKFLEARDSFPREEFYSWPELLSYPCTKAILTEAVLKGKDALKQLLDYGNEKCFMELAYLCEEFSATEEYQEIVCKAILRGLRSSVELLMRKACRLSSKALELTIALHWNDLMREMMTKTDIGGDGVYVSLLRTSIKASNDAALMYLLENEQRYASDTLRESYQTASTLGRCTALKRLLQTFPLSTLDPSVLSTAIHRAALNNHWQCVRLLLDTGAPVDVLMHGYQDAESNVLLLLVLYDQIALIRKVKTIDRSIYGTVAEHPFSVALRAGTASSSMMRALDVLGFSWHDSSTILHEAIAQGYEEYAWNTVWSALDDQIAATATASYPDQSTLYMSVLQRWRTIAFIEECTVLDGSNALCCAAQTGDSQMLRALLDRSLGARRVENVGVLNDIVFLVDSTIVGYCKIEKNGRCNVVSCCDDMIGRINTFYSNSDAKVHLKESLITVGTTLIKFFVPEHVTVQDLHADVSFRDSSSMVDNLYDLRNITDSLFSNAQQTMVYATLSKDATRSTHFLRIENVCCLYDMHRPDSRVIDLTNTLNTSDTEGKTVLQLAIEAACEQEVVQQLVRMGANPLLADIYGKTPIHEALDHPDRTLTLYLMDECLQRKLRNVDGGGLVGLTDGIKHNTLLHSATVVGDQAVVARLLQLPEPTTAIKNSFGLTPAHIAALIPLTNMISLMKQLLDYDRTPVDMEDFKGATLLQLAASADSIEMLDLVMEYEPNLALQSNRVALYEAIKRQQIRWAKRFLHHAVRKGAREVTKLADDGDDAVIMSLNCADFELSRALLEYELGHRLEDITEHDRPRIERVLKASTTKIPQVSVELQLQLRGLNESHNFLTFLRNLLDTLTSANSLSQG